MFFGLSCADSTTEKDLPLCFPLKARKKCSLFIKIYAESVYKFERMCYTCIIGLLSPVSNSDFEVPVNSISSTHTEALLTALKKEKPSLFDRVLLGTILLAAMLYLPLLVSVLRTEESGRVLSFAVCALSILAHFLLSKGKISTVGHGLLLVAVGVLLGSVHAAALLGALITTATVFCWLALTTASPLVALLPILGYAVASAVSGSFFAGALSLIGMAAALPLLFSIRTLRTKVSAICWISGGIALTAGIAVVLYLLLTRHGISAELIREELEALRTLLTQEIDSRLSLLGDELSLIPANVNRADYASMLVTDLMNRLPALIILLFNGIAFLVHAAMIRILNARKMPKEALAPMIVFDVSVASAIVYLVSLIASLALADSDTAMYAAVAENLYLILIPPMIITFWMFLNLLVFRKAPSCFGLLIYLAIFFLMVQFPTVLLPIAATAGAIVIPVAKIRSHFLNKKS